MTKKMKKQEMLDLVKRVILDKCGLCVNRKQADEFYSSLIDEFIRYCHENSASFPLGDLGIIEIKYVPPRKIKTPLMENFKRTAENYKLSLKNKLTKEKLEKIINDK